MEYITKHWWLFYVLQWTWGILLNIYGGLCALVMLITGHKPLRAGPYVYFEVGQTWGGFEAGMFYFIGKQNQSTRLHEMGHGLQNILWGPLMLLVISLPSAFRYWGRRFYTRFIYPRNKRPLKPYDSIWFEGQATNWGRKYWYFVFN